MKSLKMDIVSDIALPLVRHWAMARLEKAMANAWRTN